MAVEIPVDAGKAVDSAPITLPQPVTSGLAQARVPLSAMSVVIAKAGSSTPLIALNADRPMMPASTMKLVTTWAGLSILGRDYRWRTSAWAEGNVDASGVLHGNLYIQGRGDPKLVPEELLDLVRKIHRAGITGVDGALVLDKHYFAPTTRELPLLDGDAGSLYAVGPDPLLYSFKSLSFRLTPSTDGAVKVEVSPPLAHLLIDNELRMTTGPCRTPSQGYGPTVERGDAGIVHAIFRGAYSRRCGEQVVNEAVLDHTTFFGEGFLALWQQTGGTFTDSPDASYIREGTVPAGARLVATHDSPPLRDIVRDINKLSNNVMARNLFLTIGAVSGRPPATAQKSTRTIVGFLRKKGLAFPELVLENGSGRSRNERISAMSLSTLLQAAWSSPVAQIFIDSLPVAGVDGTMRRRLVGMTARGHAHMKTGTLRDVRAIAGYVTAADGSNYVVVSVINDVRASAAQAAHDALIEWVYEGLPSGLSGAATANR
ncbi:D-alanyl-D-alanine carboxypeptidase/D-alanyl-D-alanine-endopeptidase [Paraburkholderia sp. Tr-20389]|uniref:D-alanyl-D-alanine carboxypeptidase/D-alanyl-D-alanine endopeptidase n=1 Tax=Paraburkholderia sp. Tr-20389 TaxID=2703903 RepID=UPI001F11E371|nr:D-alanyl-D-alanine carboxypeptidase/D-alanyl-D-alanine-endopeptidase [Paraburkholderia sp. Tr-20389]